MRHNDRFDSASSKFDGRPTQESFVVEMHTLVSGFERAIEGFGPLNESQEMAGFRRELHAICSNIRDSLTRLSDGTLKLERVATKYGQYVSYSNDAKPVEEEVRVGLNPALWPKA